MPASTEARKAVPLALDDVSATSHLQPAAALVIPKLQIAFPDR